MTPDLANLFRRVSVRFSPPVNGPSNFFLPLCFLPLWLAGCASHVHFVQTDKGFVPGAQVVEDPVLVRGHRPDRSHHGVGFIHTELGRRAQRADLDRLLREKAREIGADGVMLVEYGVHRDVYHERHHRVVGRGPWRRHVVRDKKRVTVEKSASGVAFVFDH